MNRNLLSPVFRVLRKSCGIALAINAFAATAQARPGLPELDPGSIGTAAALFTAGVFLVVDWRRTKR